MGIVTGVFCVVAAFLLPWIKEIGVNVRQGDLTLKTRDEVVATAVAAEPPSADRDDASKAVEQAERQRADARHLVATAAVDSLLHPDTGPLAGCEFRLFMYVEERKRLLPVLEPDRDPLRSEGWAPGQGVTGTAWDTGDYAVAKGPACSDATFGLTPAQQARYRGLQVVAAMPVLNASGRVISVLSASSSKADSELATPAGFDEHLGLAAAMARILVDVLGWETDD